MKVNRAAVLAKVNEWADSKQAESRIEKVVQKKYKLKVSPNKRRGDFQTELDDATLRDLGMKLAEEINAVASGYGLPDSVADNLFSLQPTFVRRHRDGVKTVELYMLGDFTRPSLIPEKYGSVRNIVALFNNGYPHNGTLPSNIAKVSGVYKGEEIHALGAREGLHFMQKGVERFNAKYGNKYDLRVVLSDEYTS